MTSDRPLRVLREPPDLEGTDRSVGERAKEMTGRDGTPTLAVWYPSRRVSFGPRDRRAPGYDRAVAVAQEHGYAVRDRAMGGRPVALNPSTLAFVWVKPADETDIGVRYDSARDALRQALREVGVEATPGAPARSFCPGNYGLQAEGKIAGFAQRVQEDVCAVGGLLIVDDHAESATVLRDVYTALALDFDPGSVGSVSRAGGETDRVTITNAVVDAFQDRTF